MNNQYTAEQVYNMLMKQRFSDWYMNEFEDHVTGAEGCISSQQVINDLKNFLS